MTVTISKGVAQGSFKAPPSKSMAHRLLICGALSQKSVISGISFSEDIKATIACLNSLGANTDICGNNISIGNINFNDITDNSLFCNESGSTLRFMIPLCLLTDKRISLYGSERLMSRSLSVYKDLCLSQSIEFKEFKDHLVVKGKLNPGKYSVRGDISSQFISGLMFALPLLEKDSIIDITGALESGSYLGMTVKALGEFGIRVSRTDENTIYIKGSQTYKNRNIGVEGDYSNAAFFDALNVIGGNVSISGLCNDSTQGDAKYAEIFRLIKKEFAEIDVSDCPDLAPVIMAVAAANNGVLLTGTHRLKIKESDRGDAMACELSKFGCKVEIFENTIRVNKCNLKNPDGYLSGHNDHRIVMALAILCTLTGGTIYGAEAVSKSFPDFFDRLSSLGIELRMYNNEA